MTLQGAALASEIVAAAMAIALAWRLSTHVPAAWALAIFAAADAARLPIVARLTSLARPVDGAARWLVYLDGALMLGSAGVLPALALATCTQHARRAVAGVVVVWALASIALAAFYPSPLVRGDGLERVCLAADVLGLCVTIAAFVGWAERQRRAPATSAQAVALAMGATDLALLLTPLSPWRAGWFGRYEPAQIALLILFGSLTAFQGVLWRFS